MTQEIKTIDGFIYVYIPKVEEKKRNELKKLGAKWCYELLCWKIKDSEEARKCINEVKYCNNTTIGKIYYYYCYATTPDEQKKLKGDVKLIEPKEEPRKDIMKLFSVSVSDSDNDDCTGYNKISEEEKKLYDKIYKKYMKPENTKTYTALCKKYNVNYNGFMKYKSDLK